jgi:hypothetical protein
MDILDADSTCYENSAFNLLEILARWWPYKTSTDAYTDILPQYLLHWLP